jgi:hypothetical protein
MKLAEYERRVAAAMRAADPAAALQKIARQLDTRVDADGVRLTALLVARLRFTRLLNGSAVAAQWFADDPAACAEAFAEYHAAVAPRAFLPRDEALLFEGWTRARLRRRWLVTRRI